MFLISSVLVLVNNTVSLINIKHLLLQVNCVIDPNEKAHFDQRNEVFETAVIEQSDKGTHSKVEY